MTNTETVTLVLPEEYTRADLFNLIADANGYKDVLIKKEKIRTIYKKDEITDEVLAMNIVEKEYTADKKLVRVVVETIKVTEIPNQFSKEDFAKHIFGQELLKYINLQKNITKQAELEKRIKEVTKEVQGGDISGGEII